MSEEFEKELSEISKGPNEYERMTEFIQKHFEQVLSKFIGTQNNKRTQEEIALQVEDIKGRAFTQQVVLGKTVKPLVVNFRQNPATGQLETEIEE